MPNTKTNVWYFVDQDIDSEDSESSDDTEYIDFQMMINIKNLCIKSFYPAKYMQANNHKLVYSYRDIDDKAIADVTLTTETCKKAISTTS